MKKPICFTAALLLLILLTACHTYPGNDTPTLTTEENRTTHEPDITTGGEEEATLNISGNNHAKDNRPESSTQPLHLDYQEACGNGGLMEADFGTPDPAAGNQ